MSLNPNFCFKRLIEACLFREKSTARPRDAGRAVWGFLLCRRSAKAGREYRAPIPPQE